MGCGPAYFTGYGVAPGTYLAPFYFGTRPNPVRPAVIPPTFSPENVKLRYPPFVYDEPIRSMDTQFWRGSLPTSNPNREMVRKPVALFAPVHPDALVQDRQIVCGADSIAQRWSNGNLLSGQPFAYQMANTNQRCGCASLRK